MNRPLERIKVLDFSHVLAGPFATRILADMGADVVRVNSEERATGANDPESTYYVMWNRNKRSLALDMSVPESRPICKSLAETADVVIDNFSVGVLDRWGVGYDEVAKANPSVIYIEMSGMGDNGPWSNFVTYAPTIHALAGLTHLTGVPGREDIGIGFSYNDHQAGLHGATAILAALEARKRTGRGQRIDVSQFEVGVNFAGPTLLDFFENGTAARPTGNHLPYDDAAPHGCYPCAGPVSEDPADERWVAIACMMDTHWEALKGVMGKPAWASDERFSTAAGRAAAAQELDEHVATWTCTVSATEAMQTCQAAGVPAGVVQTSEDLVDHDVQNRHTGFLHEIAEEHPVLGRTFADKLPIRFDKTPCDAYERSHMLGEDNAAVLNEWLGISADETSQLEGDGLLK
ncbi:MAG: hypothetical protein CMQ29_02970 [Gammaproteobacteria bacterium]|nr:hypothetical protein [Gammaproteobacteria bacterium]|tara:strand:- start:142 stop:1356 length:1215 start_codon:yes stop_codon:yes gene_type:complete